MSRRREKIGETWREGMMMMIVIIVKAKEE